MLSYHVFLLIFFWKQTLQIYTVKSDLDVPLPFSKWILGLIMYAHFLNEEIIHSNTVIKYYPAKGQQ